MLHVHLAEAYNPAIILGATTKSYPVYHRRVDAGQKHDIRLLYRCPGVWLLQSSVNPMEIPLKEA